MFSIIVLIIFCYQSNSHIISGTVFFISKKLPLACTLLNELFLQLVLWSWHYPDTKICQGHYKKGNCRPISLRDRKSLWQIIRKFKSAIYKNENTSRLSGIYPRVARLFNSWKSKNKREKIIILIDAENIFWQNLASTHDKNLGNWIRRRVLKCD